MLVFFLFPFFPQRISLYIFFDIHCCVLLSSLLTFSSSFFLSSRCPDCVYTICGSCVDNKSYCMWKENNKNTNQRPVGMHWQAPYQYPPVWILAVKWRLLWRKSVWKSATVKSGQIIYVPQVLLKFTAKIELLLPSCMRVCRFLTSIELHVCGHLQISEDLKCWGAWDIDALLLFQTYVVVLIIAG